MLEFSRAVVLLFDSFLNLLGVNLFSFHVILNVLIFLKDRSVFFSSSSSSRLTYFCFFYFIFSYKEQTYQYRTESSQAESDSEIFSAAHP